MSGSCSLEVGQWRGRVTYFSGLNYTLGNEDTTLEGEMVRALKPRHVLSVCGSGGRSLPLAMAGATSLTCVDLSPHQLELARLRAHTYKELDYQEFLKFWGYAPFGNNDYGSWRKDTFAGLNLPDETRNLFNSIFEKTHWNSLLYLGKWEQTFKTLSKILQIVMGKKAHEIFEFNDLELQKEYFKNSFPHLRWNAILFLLGNKSVFNALLYKGEFIGKNVDDSHFAYYKKAYESLFTNSLARESFFANLCFYGEINHPDGNPYEAREDVYSDLKESLEAGLEVNYGRWNIMEASKHAPSFGYDFLSFSDVPSYFNGPLEQTFLQDVRDSLAPGATVVVRYYLKVLVPDTEGFEDITSRFSDLIRTEKVQMYRIKIYRKK